MVLLFIENISRGVTSLELSLKSSYLPVAAIHNIQAYTCLRYRSLHQNHGAADLVASNITDKPRHNSITIYVWGFCSTTMLFSLLHLIAGCSGRLLKFTALSKNPPTLCKLLDITCTEE